MKGLNISVNSVYKIPSKGEYELLRRLSALVYSFKHDTVGKKRKRKVLSLRIRLSQYRNTRQQLEVQINLLKGELKATKDVKDDLGLVSYRESATYNKEILLDQYLSQLEKLNK